MTNQEALQRDIETLRTLVVEQQVRAQNKCRDADYFRRRADEELQQARSIAEHAATLIRAIARLQYQLGNIP